MNACSSNVFLVWSKKKKKAIDWKILTILVLRSKVVFHRYWAQVQMCSHCFSIRLLKLYNLTGKFPVINIYFFNTFFTLHFFLFFIILHIFFLFLLLVSCWLAIIFNFFNNSFRCNYNICFLYFGPLAIKFVTITNLILQVTKPGVFRCWFTNK